MKIHSAIFTVFMQFCLTANAQSSLYADMERVGVTKGHVYVDLGLPSGTKWAECNVGAKTPEGRGNYFAWGEIAPKSSYTDLNYLYHEADLDPYFDVVRLEWGGDWRIPKATEFMELLIECKQSNVSLNGIAGVLFTGPSGNSIFLPSVGCAINENIMHDKECGYYMSSSTNEAKQSLYISTNNKKVSADYLPRSVGLSIRPVTVKIY